MWHKSHPFLLGLTDYGVQYRIEFVENNNIWENEKAYEFSILNVVQKSYPKLEEILRDFDEFIGFFGTKPE